MKIFTVVLVLFLVVIAAEGCRKPGYISRSPCADSTLRSLYEKRGTLTAEERLTFDSLSLECETFTAEMENHGKLWPWILGGVVAIFALGVIFLWLLLPHKEETY